MILREQMPLAHGRRAAATPCATARKGRGMILREQMPPGLAEFGWRKIAAEASPGTEEEALRQGSRTADCGSLLSPAQTAGRPTVRQGTMAVGSEGPVPDAGMWERGRA